MQSIAVRNFVCLVGLEVCENFPKLRYIPYNLSSEKLNSLQIFFTSYELKIKKKRILGSSFLHLRK
jgi:hypothetical protein